MVINENNSHINSFTKGMNSDQAYDQILNTQYVYGKNIRITKNQLIGDNTEDYSSLHEGIVAPVPEGVKVSWHVPTDNYGGHWYALEVNTQTSNIIAFRIDKNYLDLTAGAIKFCPKYNSYYLDWELYFNTGLNWLGGIWINPNINLLRNQEFVNYINNSTTNIFYVLYKASDTFHFNGTQALDIRTSEWAYDLTEDEVIEEYGLLGEIILAVDTVDNLGVIITTSEGNKKNIKVYRFYLNEIDNQIEEFILLWEADNVLDGNTPQVSAFLYKELENVIKLYIATGNLPIITLRVDGAEDTLLKHADSYASVDSLINNRIVPNSTVKIENITSGNLVTSQVQYTYRFYNKYKNTTQLAPLTNKIQVINPNRTKETGNAEDTQTTIGFLLSIDIADYKQDYNRLQIFRLLYIKKGEDADVSLIYDGDIKTDGDKFTFVDVGADALQKLTMEEFSVMSGLILVPKVIQQNQEYLFASNIKDDTIIKDLEVATPQDPEYVWTKVRMFEGESRLPAEKGKKYVDSEENKIVNLGGIVCSVTDYLTQRGVNSDLVYDTYNNIFTSSLLRSLRRGEKYRYGIVYYDKYGRRSDVISIGDAEIPEISSNTNSYSFETNGLGGSTHVCYAKPYGVKIKLPQPVNSRDIIGCQIVRRSSKSLYLETLLQVALARPISQELYTTKITGNEEEDTHRTSPYYPTGFLTTDGFIIHPGYYAENKEYDPLLSLSAIPSLIYDATTKSDCLLYLIFSSEIDFTRDDTLLNITKREVQLNPIYKISCGGSLSNIHDDIQSQLDVENRIKIRRPAGDIGYTEDTLNVLFFQDTNALPRKIVVDRRAITQNKSLKSEQQVLLKYEDVIMSYSPNFVFDINNIKDVIIPNWEDNFTSITRGGDESDNITSAVEKYKSFTTSIDEYTFNNWISFGKYGLRATSHESQPNVEEDAIEEMISCGNFKYRSSWPDNWTHFSMFAAGYIGPGPSCYLMTLSDKDAGEHFNITNLEDSARFATVICNIKHEAILDKAEPDEVVQYFGFGNYFELEYSDELNKYIVKNNILGKDHEDEMIVFDGDIYITPHEITTMYKTYNFEAGDSLQSIQVVNYIPLESKVNTYFDYGMNYRNTNSKNLLYLPGTIEGVCNQDRAVHQYNQIYSDNDVSNDMFTLITTDKNETNEFKQRTYYSDLKSNGEFIDNFLIFKPAQFIDVDSKYGQITNLLTDKNTLFYWQEHGFGKFSVNERSLVNDLNGNTIMLGLAGILSRYDYISTKYGMRMYDFCARTAELNVYWVDINNKAVVVGNTSQAANYGELIGVLNIINNNITNDIPKVDFDLQNSELLCKCFGEDLIVFNVKYNFATSVYNRRYDSMAYIKNHIYGIKVGSSAFTKYNYLDKDALQYGYLSPVEFSFVVNPVASVTKVFDNLLIVPIKRDSDTYTTFLNNKISYAFETDIVKKGVESAEPHIDREGNVLYAVPRYTDERGYGNRTRGKWLKVDIAKEDPNEYFTISHVLTKFRQSFS